MEAALLGCGSSMGTPSLLSSEMEEEEAASVGGLGSGITGDAAAAGRSGRLGTQQGSGGGGAHGAAGGGGLHYYMYNLNGSAGARG